MTRYRLKLGKQKQSLPMMYWSAGLLLLANTLASTLTQKHGRLGMPAQWSRQFMVIRRWELMAL